MISLSKLLRGAAAVFPGDRLRYAGELPCPVVVWHMTAACNLKCGHCYSAGFGADAMSPRETGLFLRHLSAIRPPSLLFSGGEPLMHPLFFEYLAEARVLALNTAISTNGTLIDRGAAEEIAAAGVSYVGVSLDGVGASHDEFRGVEGSFDRAIAGVENLRRAGCRVGLRVTLARPVLPQLGDIFALAESLGVLRVCFYHFIPSGRGAGSASLMPSREEERQALRRIFDWTDGLTASGGTAPEVLTVGDSSDGPFLYRYLLQRRPVAAPRALALLEKASRRGIGEGIASVRWDGALFANQFAWDEQPGSWRELPLKRPKAPGAACRGCGWTAYCSGSLRIEKAEKGRAESDARCVLTEEERRADLLA